MFGEHIERRSLQKGVARVLEPIWALKSVAELPHGLGLIELTVRTHFLHFLTRPAFSAADLKSLTLGDTKLLNPIGYLFIPVHLFIYTRVGMYTG